MKCALVIGVVVALVAAGCGVELEEGVGEEVGEVASGPPSVGVTLVYFVPRDVPVRGDYQTAIVNGAFAAQAYYRSQLGNRTFGFAPVVRVCRGDKDQWQYSQNPRGQIEQEAIARCGVSLDFGQQRPRFLIYADVYQQCGAQGAIGNASGNLAILPRQDLEGLLHGLGDLQTYYPSMDDCGSTFFWNANRWIYGMAHELAHTMGIAHPPGCEQGACVGNGAGSVMWTGVFSGVNYWGPGQPWFMGQDQVALLAGPFIGTVP